MNKLSCLLLVVFSVVASISSHSLPMSPAMRKRVEEYNKDKDLPVVWSYHIHCNFVNSDNDQVKAAAMLRESFINYFNLTNVTPCKSTFDDIRLCMFRNSYLS